MSGSPEVTRSPGSLGDDAPARTWCINTGRIWVELPPPPINSTSKRPINSENLYHTNMPLFSSSRRSRTPRFTTPSSRSRRTGFRNPLRRRDPDRVAGGYKSALSNPNTTHGGRKHAKRELRLMGRGNETHVPLMTKIKRTLGIRSTPRSERHPHTVSTSRTRTRRNRNGFFRR